MYKKVIIVFVLLILNMFPSLFILINAEKIYQIRDLRKNREVHKEQQYLDDVYSNYSTEKKDAYLTVYTDFKDNFIPTKITIPIIGVESVINRYDINKKREDYVSGKIEEGNSMVLGEENSIINKEINNELNKGVVYYDDQNEGIMLFGHSSSDINSKYQYIFLNLEELTIGDSIILENSREVIVYKVLYEKVINPEDLLGLDYNDNELILVTCYPVGSTKERFIIKAVKQEVRYKYN